jgi:hypothetical protein
MSVPTMNTFSAEEANRLHDTTTIKILTTKQIKVLSIDEILHECNLNSFPDLLTIDIEGIESDIIDNLEVYPIHKKPKVICLETLEYSERALPEKEIFLIKKMEKMDYFLYADTYINSIFVQNKFYKNTIIKK